MNRTITKALAVAAALSMGVTTLAACGSSNSVDESKGKVYYLNFKPEAADQWKAIAETYTKETGVQVTIETAASGTYEQTLKSEMAKDQAPPCSRSTARSVTPAGRITATICPTPPCTSSSKTPA